MGPTHQRILIIDDDHGHREAVRELLVDEGYDTVEASDGGKALTYLVSVSPGAVPALILLDLQMEPMTGWEFLSVLKSYLRLSTIPVVLVSGREPSIDVVAHGTVAAYVRKPFSNEQLLKTIAEVLARRAGA
jgi:CheY-like chemotaxis protein